MVFEGSLNSICCRKMEKQIDSFSQYFYIVLLVVVNLVWATLTDIDSYYNSSFLFFFVSLSFELNANILLYDGWGGRMILQNVISRYCCRKWGNYVNPEYNSGRCGISIVLSYNLLLGLWQSLAYQWQGLLNKDVSFDCSLAWSMLILQSGRMPGPVFSCTIPDRLSESPCFLCSWRRAVCNLTCSCSSSAFSSSHLIPLGFRW